MTKVYPFRFTHKPSGYSVNIDFEGPNTVEMMRNGHKPLQERTRKVLYRQPSQDEELSTDKRNEIYDTYDEFLWKDIEIEDLESYDKDNPPPTPPAA